MEIDIFKPIIKIIGLLTGLALIGAFLSLFVLAIYTFFRSLIRRLLKIDTSINYDWGKLKDKELFAVIIISYLTVAFSIWRFDFMNFFVFGYCGFIFSFTGPFFLLYFLSKKQMEITVKIILSAFLLLCLLNLTLEDYKAIKYICLFSFALLAYYSFEKNLKISLIIYVSLTLIYQPYIKFILKRDWWDILDIIVSVGLISSLFFKSPKQQTEKGYTQQ